MASKGGFFFTGEFCELYPDVVKRLLDRAFCRQPQLRTSVVHALGRPADSLLVTHEFERYDGYRDPPQGKYRIQRRSVYIPPYEYYNKEISAWAKNMGIQVIATPGTQAMPTTPLRTWDRSTE